MSRVFIATPADTEIGNTSDVTILTTDVASLAVNDQLIVEAFFLLNNNSGTTRTHTFTLDFDAAFDVEITCPTMASSSTAWNPFHLWGVLHVDASNLAYGEFIFECQLAAGLASGADTTMAATHLRGSGWGSTASNLTGTVTVALLGRCAATEANHTVRLLSLTIDKETPT